MGDLKIDKTDALGRRYAVRRTALALGVTGFVRGGCDE
jgi:hypothetical protein